MTASPAVRRAAEAWAEKCGLETFPNSWLDFVPMVEVVLNAAFKVEEAARASHIDSCCMNPDDCDITYDMGVAQVIRRSLLKGDS